MDENKSLSEKDLDFVVYAYGGKQLSYRTYLYKNDIRRNKIDINKLWIKRVNVKFFLFELIRYKIYYNDEMFDMHKLSNTLKVSEDELESKMIGYEKGYFSKEEDAEKFLKWVNTKSLLLKL